MANNAALTFVLSLNDKISSPLKKISAGFDSFAQKNKENAMLMAAGWGTVFGAFKGLQATLAPAMEMNKALNDVRGFDVSEQGLKRLNNSALDFMASYGGSATSFVKSAGSISQAIKGLTDSQLVSFTKATNLLGVETKQGGAAATHYINTVYGGFKSKIDAMGKSEWVTTFSSQTAAATKLFRTDINQLNAAFKESGALANQMGLSFTDQLASIGTLSGTMDGGKAGGALKAMFENIHNASGKLGLSFTDSAGQMLPMVEIVDKLNSKFGNLNNVKNLQAIRDGFGGGAEAVMALMKNTDQLRNGMAKLGNIHGLEHLQKLAEQNVDPWQKFNGQVQAMRISFGQALLPILSPVFDKLTSIGKTLQRWTVLFPSLTKLVGIFTLAILANSIMTGGATLMIGLFKNAMLGLKVISTITKAVWLFNAALLANPLTWIVVGIIAVIAAIAACIYYWDDITAAIGKFSDFIMGGVSDAIDWVMTKLTDLGNWFTSTKSWVGTVRDVWLSLVKIIAGAIDKIIEYINYIPGVDIQFRASDHLPNFSDIDDQTTKLKKASNPVLAAQNVNPPAAGGGIMNNYIQLQSAQNAHNSGKSVSIENFTVNSPAPLNQGELHNMFQMAGP